MSYSATVFNVLIASPSDVPEREVIAQVLHEWNALHSKDKGMVLLPVMWETHSAPAMGDRPQEVINRQLVKSCDMLVGAFWTRLGSPTGIEESGTVEEIKAFLKNKKPVMLYFSKARPDLDDLDTKQLERLKKFRSEIRGSGLQEEYNDENDLKQKLMRQLTIITREMTLSPVVTAQTIKKVSESGNEKLKENNSEIYFESITDRAFVVRGDTSHLKDKLKDMGGKWIQPKSGGSKGWMFAKRHLQKVADALNLPAELRAE